MKKLFLFCAALICAVSVSAKTIYLNTGGSSLWNQGGAVFFVHSWEGTNTNEQDIKMSLYSGDIYSVEVPDGNSKIIFVRMPNGSPSLDWDSKWNKTSDLSIPNGKNCYTITGWGESDGAWVYYDGSGDPEVPCVNNFGLRIDGTTIVEAVRNTQQTDFLEYMATGIVLTEGQTVEVYNICAEEAWVIANMDEAGCSLAISDNKYQISESGSYDFYIKMYGVGNDQIYIAKDGQGCGGGGDVTGSSVPSQCGDVLLQGFYYDSYKDNDAERGTDLYGNTRWKTLLAQSGEIGAYFDMIWLPPSALASGTGYHPRQYSNQNSDWGTRADLEKLIAAFHNSGTKVVADMVVNHLEAMSSWCDFAVQDFGQYGVFQPDGSWVCNTDEMNMEGCREDAGECFGTATGAADDGPTYDGKNESNYAAARDMAHNQENVREMYRAYAQWMINEMHYDGFRYDYCKGFHASHIGDYNRAGGAYISFMELWASVGAIQQAINDAQGNTMSLDFPGKYNAFNDGIAAFNYNGCKGSGMLGAGLAKHAVTFVDNHDTFLRDDNEFGGHGNSMKPEMKDRLLQANAFLLGMPGVPCVFYPHWAKYKEEIKAMINARHLAGVHSESAVSDESEQGGYKATVQGKNGTLILCLGNKAGETISGYTKVASGAGYAMWVQATGDVAPGLIVTPSSTFEDSIAGIDVTIQAVGGRGTATIYYTTDGTDPTTASAQYTSPLNFKETTTLKVMAKCGEAQSRIQEYTYTYREPLVRGIRVRFNKPAEWEKAYIYAWKEIITDTDTTSEFILGAFPGARLYMDSEGWYSYEFDADLNDVKFQLSSGTDCGSLHVESNNLETDYDVCYGWRADKEGVSKEEEEMDCETQLNPQFALVITPESGYFHDPAEGVDVKIYAVGVSNAMIYYTTDGTEPTTDSQMEVGEVNLKVSATTVVKAFAYDPASRESTPVYAERYAYKAPQSGPLTVKFIQPQDWKDLYIYAFTRVKIGNKFIDTPYALDGKTTKWPGIKWTQTEGAWHTYTLPADIHEIYVIFTEGDKKPQTQDIYVDENTCYLWNPSCRQAVVDTDCDGEPDSPWEGIEEIIDASKKENEAYKLIIDGRLVIINRGVMYDAMGRRM